MLIYYLLVLCLLLGLLLFVAGMYQAQHEAPESAADKLARVRERRAEIAPDRQHRAEAQLDRDFAQREEQRVRAARRTTFLPSLSGVAVSSSILMRMEEDLIQSRSGWRATELIAASIVATLVLFIVLVHFSFPLILAIPFAATCLVLPWVYVRYVKTKYYRRFEEQLADTLLMMANSLKAGFSFLQSMEMVSRESHPPMSDEIRRVTQEIAVGVPVNDALENLGARIKSADLDLMVTAVLIQREVGSSLAEILEIISSVIRERLRIRGEIRTLTAQGKITGTILGMLPIILGILLHFITKAVDPERPSYISVLLNTDQGLLMLVMAIVMQILGFICIWKIVNIRV